MATKTIPEYLEDERRSSEETQMRTDEEAARIQSLHQGHHRTRKSAKLELPVPIEAAVKARKPAAAKARWPAVGKAKKPPMSKARKTVAPKTTKPAGAARRKPPAARKTGTKGRKRAGRPN